VASPGGSAADTGAGQRARGGEAMTKEQIDEFELTLFKFVKRAAGEGATAEEVEALPAVARVLMELLR